jgi:heat shock protein beta
MRLLRPLLSFLSLTLISTNIVLAQDLPSANGPKEKHDYQSDVARLRKIVINSLYSHRDVFLRELISNANDALEKLRLTALTDKGVWDGVDPLNITIKAIKNEQGPGGRLVISDTGIGMTPDELKTNLGTLAKSGTSDFLARAESESSSAATGNLIGAFGLGFYSSFLVADQVYVASVAPKSDTQYVFSSSADEGSFEVYPDPRGNTLGRGTEITLILKDDAFEYVDNVELSKLVAKHSGFSTSFPIYLFSQATEEVPIEEPPLKETASKAEDEDDKDNDEAVVEEVPEDQEETKTPKTKTVVVDKWSHLNAAPPLWQRDPKDVSTHEYRLFYQNTFKDFKDPLAWHHFSGDSDDGVAFKAIVYVPSELNQEYWNNPLLSSSRDIRLMVKRVFITSDLGDDAMPKWASWVKAVVDADDLPLNVSRETLQSTKFLKQLKQVILKRLIQLIARLAEEEPEKFNELQNNYGAVLKLGALEDYKNRDKLAVLTRFSTNQRNNTSLNEYLENKKEGQKQIFYLADTGKSIEDLRKSVFVEKLDARGYEVLLLNQPVDELLIQGLRNWKKIPFQDVAKAGLKFGDEELDPEDKVAFTEKYKPLLDWIKAEVSHVVEDVVISSRLVSSPCAIVANFGGYSANFERMISMQNSREGNEHVQSTATKRQKLLEINPRSPLIEGLLRRVAQLPDEEEGRDLESEEELKEVVSILIDGALVRSGYEVSDSNKFFTRVDRVLRRSLGVSETAPTDTRVKPAPPVNPVLEEEEEETMEHHFQIPAEMKEKVSLTMEEIDDEGNPMHDEL